MTAADAAALRRDLLDAVQVARAHAASSSAGRQVPTLADELYAQWYTRAGNGISANPGDGPPTLVARLRASHACADLYEEGWTVAAVDGAGSVVAQRSGDIVEVLAGDYVNTDRLGAPPRVGDTVMVSARRDHIDRENGWWMCDGRAGPAPPLSMTRIYWNCPTSAVVDLLSRLSTVLEGAAVAYTMKCPVEPALFGRVDGVVLYLESSTFRSLGVALRSVHRQLAPSLGDLVPPLTLRLGRGVAAAEDPADGRSFGQSRCAAVADGFERARAIEASDEEAVAVILDTLPQHGIAPGRPYLSVGSPPDRIEPW